jgi:hypothetical protein
MTDAQKELLNLSKVQLLWSLDQLNKTWKRVNQLIKGLHIPVSAVVVIDCGDDEGTQRHFAWFKHQGEWQVCLTEWNEFSERGNVIPILSATAEERLQNLDLDRVRHR